VRFAVFNPWPVYGSGGAAGWPLAPRHALPDRVAESAARALDLAELADEVGFDYVTVAEHHYHGRQGSAAPIVAAAAISQRVRRAGIAVLGVALPLANPVRVAEELALLDALCGGRLLAGLFRGTPNEFLVYGTNPAQSREMYEEAVDLVLAAWTEPEPFGWLGRHYDFRTVAVWPRPVQRPHPPVVTAGNSPGSARYAAAHKLWLGVSFGSPEHAAALGRIYREAAAEAGWEPAPEQLLLRHFCLVADTDAAAGELVRTHQFGNMARRRPDPVLAAVAAAMNPPAPAPNGTTAAGAPAAGLLPTRPLFAGAPDTVTAQIRDFAAATGFGFFDLIFNDGNLPYAASRRSVELFGREVLPHLKAAAGTARGRRAAP
jgi:alkanesulfonate monooxygenase SsuD/methylene tetrahydromethanopterin reductase-like flavin-dependent oxidoreductase (luciferase family)